MSRLFIGFLLFWPFLSFAQYNEVLPVQFSQFYQNFAFINPGATAYKHPVYAVAGNKSLDGIFKEVQTNYASGSIRLGGKDTVNRNFHGIGATILSSREGPYFTRSRVCLSYAWHNSISEKWMLSLGLMTGLINHLYKETDLLPARSALRFTSDAGLFIYKPGKISIGLSINQFIPSSMAPLEPGLKIKTFASLIVDYYLRISPFMQWRNSLVSRGPVRTSSLDMDLASMLVLQEMVSLGLQYKLNMGYSFVVGIESGQMKRQGLNLFFSYFRSFDHPGNLTLPTMEMTLSIFKK
jgi:type IX secretion system PorP/SprF family membrane protein